MKNTLWIFLAAAYGALASGCVVSSNYYSGRTLEENKFSFGFGADDIVIKSATPSIEISKDKPFSPSMAISYGLPLRLEAGARFFPPKFLELSLRHQVNPRDFDIIDGSVNVTYARLFGGYSYIKYGATVSKNINELEPYVHYSFYKFIGADKGDFSDSFTTGYTDDVINRNRVIGFGIALPLHKAKLYPEVDYQYFGSSLKNGLWHVGIGFRVYVN